MEQIKNLINLQIKLKPIQKTFYDIWSKTFINGIDNNGEIHQQNKQIILEIYTTLKTFLNQNQNVISKLPLNEVKKIANDILKKEINLEQPLVDYYYQSSSYFILIPYLIQILYQSYDANKPAYKAMAKFIIKNNLGLFKEWDLIERQTLEIVKLKTNLIEDQRKVINLFSCEQREAQHNRFVKLFNNFILVYWTKEEVKYIEMIRFLMYFAWIPIIFIILLVLILGLYFGLTNSSSSSTTQLLLNLINLY
ncbi:conserved hypothetical protein [Ureaplasma urealyticum serovar 10 str. ATCC 33699]|uniref:Uncharacterized protein n=1 Tax=Ureaplasma urealyticum serovar 10 (strain ATCC 33699 / Western) TaxID=565575 RepID=B5ZB83_UREU1|nr:hypothetical protein [Ureaplasma urealyticum]ACI60146.1 conserved hypothetical protein [Ureaplasma urealyticum serovar 10 str. ATCC 33699]